MTLQQFLATDATDDNYEQALAAWVASKSLVERMNIQDELCEMFRLEAEGIPYEGDHDLEDIFNRL